MWLGFYSRYIADDFEFANAARELGVFGTCLHWYLDWSGRFSATFVLAGLGRCGPAITPFVPATILALWCSASYAVVRRLWCDAPPVAALTIALSFVYVCLDGGTDVFQSLLWQSGAVTYAVPLVVITLGLARVLANSDSRWRVYGEPAVLAFIVGGFSEIVALNMVAFSAISTIAAAGRLRRCACAALAGSVLALVIVAVAPGNGTRRAHFSPPSPTEELSQTVRSTSRFLAQTPASAGVGIVVILLASILARSSTSESVGPWRRAAVAMIIMAVAAAVITHFTPIHVGYGSPPSRALITPQFFIACAAVTIGRALNYKPPARIEAVLWSALLLTAVAGPLVASRRNAALVPDARVFAARWDDIVETLKRSPGKHVLVQAPPTVAGLSFISEDVDAWSNKSMARYFGAQSVARLTLTSRR
jgi:hypothetical protein